ncbi:hypothetical protein [Anaerocolumna sp. MB42-C2]|uniref:hypothetical protein n=1 Tax=Anaerocolumna sp. MB42-C2 TaxID=3070997 RepID=UPI0027DFFA62|nr:hypothetical protein [Anaerocolumna sp. MB42-C2]WMJ88529.1 hypothetical protein RBU59_03165 [Anaerocolumna sp. MB42-C2]
MELIRGELFRIYYGIIGCFMLLYLYDLVKEKLPKKIANVFYHLSNLVTGILFIVIGLIPYILMWKFNELDNLILWKLAALTVVPLLGGIVWIGVCLLDILFELIGFIIKKLHSGIKKLLYLNRINSNKDFKF